MTIKHIIIVSKGAFLISLVFFAMLGCDYPPESKNYNITCYAAAYGGGVYKTVNGGLSWFPLSLDQRDFHHYFKRLYLHPQNKQELYITTSGAGLFKLDLEKEVLQPSGPFHRGRITALAFADVSKTRYDLLLGLNAEGVYGRSFRGESWLPLNFGLSYREVHVLFLVGRTAFAGTAKDLFRWDGDSQQWMSTSHGIQNKNIFSIGTGPRGKTLFAGSGPYYKKNGFFQKIPCLYQSHDEGLTWSPSDAGIPGGTMIYCILSIKNKPGRIYAGTSRGFYRSADGGESWHQEKKGLPKGLKVYDLKTAQTEDGNVFIYGATSLGLFMTLDQDDNYWMNQSYGLPPTAITSLVVGEENGERLKVKIKNRVQKGLK